MKKTFLARVLAVAVTITAVLPGGGALTANAATIQTTQEGWKIERDNDNWDGSFDDALNLGGVQTWHLQSSSTDGNGHKDLSVAAGTDNAAATVYAKGIDITAPDTTVAGKTRKLSFDIYPKGTVSNMRFGVLLKYVDATHYVYLGLHNSNHWFLEWGPGITTSTGENRYTGAITDLEAFSLEDNKFHRITVEYLSSSQIKVTMQKMKEQPKDDGSEETEWVVDDTQDAVETTLDNEAILAVKTYAVSTQSPDTAKPIYFGFLGGTYSGNLTDVDIANVQTNVTDPSEMASLRYAYCDWTSPKPGADPDKILQVNSIGGVNYRSVDADADKAKTLINSMEELADFEDGTISAVLRPYLALDSADEVTRPFYLNTRVVSAQGPETSVKVGYNGTSWGYQIGSGAFQAVQSAAKPKRMHDYKVDVTFNNGKMSAKAVEVQYSGNEDRDADDYLTNDYSTVVPDSEIVIADDVSLTGAPTAGTIAVTVGAGLRLRVRNVNYTKVNATEFEDWTDSCKTAYTTVMGRQNTNPVTYYKDAWDAYAAARAAKDAVLTGDGVITAQGARDIVSEMSAAWTAFDIDENKIAIGKNALTDAQSDLETKAATGHYTYDETAFNEAKTAIEAALTKINNEPGTVVKADVTAAIAKYDAVTFTEKTADAADKAAIDTAVEEATAGVNDAEAEFYDNWEEYQNALSALNALKEKDNATKKEIDEAIAALEEAVQNRTLKAADQADKNALKNSIAAIKTEVERNLQPNAAYNAALQKAEALANGSEATTKKALADALKALETAKNGLAKKAVAPTVSAGQTVTFGGADYTVANVAAKTVVLKEGKDVKQKKVVVPATITIGSDSYKVVGIAANAFKNYKNIKNITIGDNVASIEKNAFPNCAKLTKLTFKTSKVTLKKKAFGKVKKTVKIKASKTLKKDKKFKKSLKKAGLKKYKL